MLIRGMLTAKVMIELDVKVCELVDAIVTVDLSLPHIILTDKVAVLQILQEFRQVSTSFFLQLLTDFLSCQSFLVGSQQLDDIDIGLRTLEESFKQTVKLLLHFRITAKEQTVDIGRKTLPIIQQT